MSRSRLFPCALLVLAACGTPSPRVALAPAARSMRSERVQPHGGAEASPLLLAMQAELDRSMSAFKTKPDAPYFLAYAVADDRRVSISASLGASFETVDDRGRTLDVDLRVGDPRLDNTHPFRDSDRFERWLESWDNETHLPIEDDPGPIRSELWAVTAQRHRKAVERLARVRAERKIKVSEEDSSDDFSTEPPVKYLEAPATLAFDRARWEAATRDYSRLFAAYPEILDGRVSLDVATRTRSFVSTDGTMIQTPWTNVRLGIWARAKADDGMELSRFESFDVASMQGLPDDGTIRGRIGIVVDDLLALRKAPVAEPWSGPAILEGRAAGVFFHEVFGHRMEGHRQKSEEEGQTFARKLGRLVMPEFIRVYDDPTLRRIEGFELNGHYLYDDEGVPAQRADLVDHGILKTFLMSRSPARGVRRSNGHGRRQEGLSVVARQGNLIVDPVVTVPAHELRNRLLAEIRRQHAPYGLRFREISGGYTNTQREDPQAFKVLPVMVYRVYPEGREELVRGVDLEGTPLTSLSHILAAGDDIQVFNGHCGAESGWVPVAAASPSLLLEEIEVSRRTKDQDRPPILPSPIPGEHR